METYYYDIRKQVFEYDEEMNNQRRAYSERRRVLDGSALKKQVIGYGERTMSEIEGLCESRSATRGVGSSSARW